MTHRADHPLRRQLLWLALIMMLPLALAIGWFVVGLPGEIMWVWAIAAAVMWVDYWRLQRPAGNGS